MKKLFLLVLFVILVAIGGTFAYHTITKEQIPQIASVQNARESVPKDNTTQTERIGTPQKILIPKIGVEAIVEQTGKDSKGRMDIPKDWNNTAWYMYGPKPGEIGNAVIDGHVDTPSGDPSVFADLTKLKNGDRISIIDENGTQIDFSVTDIQTYELSKIPLGIIFGPSEKSQLNLITCGGEWDKVKKDYTDRIVVYSERI